MPAGRVLLTGPVLREAHACGDRAEHNLQAQMSGVVKQLEAPIIVLHLVESMTQDTLLTIPTILTVNSIYLYCQQFTMVDKNPFPPRSKSSVCLRQKKAA